MSQKTVLSVGQCGPDHASISRFLNHHFDVQILAANLLDDTMEALRRDQVDLVLINRKLDADYSDGMEILKAIKADPEFASLPAMIISNFPEAQEQAVAAGAVPGFGKAQLDSAAARDAAAAVLSSQRNT